jgi:hypothetical protein
MQEKTEYPAHRKKDGLGMGDKKKRKVDARLSGEQKEAAKYEPRGFSLIVLSFRRELETRESERGRRGDDDDGLSFVRPRL